VEKRVNLFVLETNPTEIELISLQARKAGLQATIKRAGSMDLLLNAARDAPPDCVLANLSTPRFDVTSAIDGFRKQFPRVPWIIYALNGNEETAVQCMKAGAADFVLKRHITRLGASIKDAIEKSQAAPPPVVQEEEGRKEEKPEPEGKNLFQRMVESSPDLIAVLTPDGRREYNNPAYGRVLEDPDVLVGTDSFLDIVEEDRARIRTLFQEIFKRGYGERTEYRLMDKEGDTRVIQSNSGVILNDEGDPEKVVVMSRDITDMVRDRQRIENLFAATASLDGEDFFNVLVHRLADVLGVHSVLVSRPAVGGKGRVQSLAYWAENHLQKAVEYDVAGSPCERVLFDGETIMQAEGVRGAFPKMNIPGSSQAEGYIGTPLQSPDGKGIGLLVIHDPKPITDAPRKEFILRIMAKRASLELLRMARLAAPEEGKKGEGSGWKEMEARYRSALEGLPFPVVMTDDQGMILLVNSRLEELCGMRENDLLGRRAWPLVLRGGPWSLLKEEYGEVVVRPDRSQLAVSVYAIPCRNSEGRIAGTLGILKLLQDPTTTDRG
jgi:PAS domain S-box-containing protein